MAGPIIIVKYVTSIDDVMTVQGTVDGIDTTTTMWVSAIQNLSPAAKDLLWRQSITPPANKNITVWFDNR